MTSPKEYQHQIKSLGLEDLKIRVTTVAEAKEAQRQIRDLQRKLRQIKKSINIDMKAIRVEYNQRISTAASTSSALVSLFGKRKLAGQLRADEKRRLRMERDRALQPYDALKLQIDNLLAQLDSVKYNLQIFIEDAKTKTQVKRQTHQKKKGESSADSVFCPQCGALVAKADKFCRNCGNKLK